jgi:hypothetical protein
MESEPGERSSSDIEAKGVKDTKEVKELLRTDFEEFVYSLEAYYEIILWTIEPREVDRCLSKVIAPILESIDPEGVLPWRLYADDCVELERDYGVGKLSILTKDLKKLKRDPSGIVMLDVGGVSTQVNPLSVINHYDNTYLMEAYEGDRSDSNLKNLIKPLIMLSKMRDVRPVTRNLDTYFKNKFQMKQLNKHQIPEDEVNRQAIRVQDFQPTDLKGISDRIEKMREIRQIRDARTKRRSTFFKADISRGSNFDPNITMESKRNTSRVSKTIQGFLREQKENDDDDVDSRSDQQHRQNDVLKSVANSFMNKSRDESYYLREHERIREQILRSVRSIRK